MTKTAPGAEQTLIGKGCRFVDSHGRITRLANVVAVNAGAAEIKEFDGRTYSVPVVELTGWKPGEGNWVLHKSVEELADFMDQRGEGLDDEGVERQDHEAMIEFLDRLGCSASERARERRDRATQAEYADRAGWARAERAAEKREQEALDDYLSWVFEAHVAKAQFRGELEALNAYVEAQLA